MTNSRTLLIARVGPDSLHRHWLAPEGARTFDLLLSAYDESVTAPRAAGVYFEYRPGRKVAGYAALLREHRALWARYDHVALFDDDLLIDATGLERLFAIVAAHRPRVAQPALSHDSYFTYAALLRHPGFLLRHMTYVEMMCPVFRVDALAEILPLFDLGFESGIDIIWSNLLARAPEDLAVIDAVTVRHTRRVGSVKASNGFAGRFYEDDIHALLARFDCPWLPCLPYDGIRTDGRAVTGRGAFLPDALALAAAVPLLGPMKRRARNIAVYWKHLLTARPHNVPLAWPALQAQDALRRDAAPREIEQR